MGKPTARNLLLLAIAATGSLVVAEVFVRLFVPVRLVGSSVTTFDSVYGHRNKSNLTTVQITPEYRMRISTNSLGHRGPELEARTEGSVLFIGDSFTLGLGVSDGEEFPALISETIQNELGTGAPPVVNAGLGNTAQGRWIKFLRLEAEAFSPRLIVFQLHENDFSDNLSRGLFTLSDDGALVEHSLPPPGSGRLAQGFMESVPLLSRTYLMGLVRQAYHGWRSGSPSGETQDRRNLRIDEENRLTFGLLEKALTICAERGWPAIGLVVGLDGERKSGVEEVFEGYGIPTRFVPGKEE